jgi:multidrug efflux pump subunit AcrA (membrane-fusion protein)
VRAAQRDATSAQTLLARAQTDLNTLTRGPDPTELRDAQAQLQRAQTQLQLAQLAKIDPQADQTLARIQQDAAVQDAQSALRTAETRLTKLKQPPAEAAVQAARQAVQDAQDSFSAATQKLERLQAGPDDSAVAGAQATADAAEQALALAEARRADVLSRPSGSELADAQDQVRKAQAVLDAARQPAAAATEPIGSDIAQLQQELAQSLEEVSTLEKALAKTEVTSPVDGVVVSVRAKPKDVITPDKPALVIATSSASLMHVNVNDDDATLLAVGQAALVHLDSVDDSAVTAPAVVITFTPATPNGSKGAEATLKVDWPAGRTPRFGSTLQVDVMVQQKADALVVPKTALRQSAGKPAVEVMNGTLRRLVTVQVGIKTDTMVEILSGLTEGQLVTMPAGR